MSVTPRLALPRSALALGLALALALPLLGCRTRLPGLLPGLLPEDTSPAAAPPLVASTTQPAPPPLGDGAAPGDKDGAGGFVPRGTARSFYAGAGGRLWYYMNNYYWVSDTAPREDLWIKAEVAEQWRDLRRWPDGRAAPDSVPKVTTEYWRVGKTGRTVRLDNHKDYCLLERRYTAGAVVVEVTLTLGHVAVRDGRGRWDRPREAYVLESRNYRGGGGRGAEAVRFDPLPFEAVTTWRYRVPWSTHPQPLTRSSWQDLALPSWERTARHHPAEAPAPDPALTPSRPP